MEGRGEGGVDVEAGLVWRMCLRGYGTWGEG